MYPMFKHNIPMNTSNSGGHLQILKSSHNCMLGNFACLLLPANIIQNKRFQKYYFLNTIRMSNSMNSEFVGPDLGQKLFAKYINRQHTQRKQITIQYFHTFHNLNKILTPQCHLQTTLQRIYTNTQRYSKSPNS